MYFHSGLGAGSLSSECFSSEYLTLPNALPLPCLPSNPTLGSYSHATWPGLLAPSGSTMGVEKTVSSVMTSPVRLRGGVGKVVGRRRDETLCSG